MRCYFNNRNLGNFDILEVKVKKPLLIVIAGPTAAGKTKTAIQLAQRFNTHIFSADSRQFYRELTIGTAKPTFEELQQAHHHFINNLSITEDYSVGDYEREVIASLDLFFKNYEVAILTGGSGLYIDAALKGFDTLPDIKVGVRETLNEEYNAKGIS